MSGRRYIRSLQKLPKRAATPERSEDSTLDCRHELLFLFFQDWAPTVLGNMLVKYDHRLFRGEGYIKLIDHDQPVTCMDAYMDGDLVTGSDDGLRLWHANECVSWVVTSRPGLITAFSAAPERKKCVLMSDLVSRWWVWDMETTDILCCFRMIGEGMIATQWVMAKKLVFLTTTGRLLIFDWHGLLLKRFTTAIPTYVGIRLLGGAFLTGNKDGMIMRSQEMNFNKKFEHAPEVMCPLAGGGWLTGMNKEVFLWSQTGEKLGTWRGHTQTVTVLGELPDGRVLSGSNDKTLRVWTRNGSCEMVIETYSPVTLLCVMSDGTVAVGTNYNLSIKMFR